MKSDAEPDGGSRFILDRRLIHGAGRGAHSSLTPGLNLSNGDHARAPDDRLVVRVAHFRVETAAVERLFDANARSRAERARQARHVGARTGVFSE